MSSAINVIAQGALIKATEDARRSGRARVSTEDATKDSQEHRAHKPSRPGVGVFAALAQAGIRLTLEQRRSIDRVLRIHVELATQPMTPNAAVERLMMHGVKFTDRQLELVSDERSVSGFRRLESAFDDVKTTASHPAYRPASRTEQLEAIALEGEGGGFIAWVKRVFGISR